MIALKCLLALSVTTASPPDTIRTRQLDEVVIVRSSSAQRLQSATMGAEQVSISELATMPALLGEHDVLRSIQLLPGVKHESEASSGFQVRGGTSAQNSLL